MARLGATSAAHPVEPEIRAEARGLDSPRPGVAAPRLSPPVEVRTSSAPRTTVTACGPEGLATTGRSAALQTQPPPSQSAVTGVATATHGVPLVESRANRRDPIARPRARGPAGGGEAYGLRTLRRTRVPWAELGRARLAAAWGRVKTEHAGSGALELVGVFGPVPIEALESVALDVDGRLAMTFSRRGLLGRRGDVALARVVESGRLVRCDIAHPAIG